jgi:hypothetical protein
MTHLVANVLKLRVRRRDIATTAGDGKEQRNQRKLRRKPD